MDQNNPEQSNQNMTQPAQPQNQSYYQPVSVPSEPGKKAGTTEGVIAIISGVISLLFIPIVFGIAGITLGVVSYRKGSKTLGLVASILSAVFMIIGVILGILAQALLHNNAVRGLLWGV
jgi:lipopolysaccharide export LptBFGC system permease protein LptF